MSVLPKYERYKDSGVEWLEEIPEHWDVEHSKWLFSQRKERCRRDDEQLTASQKYGVIIQLQRLLERKLQYGANEEATFTNRGHPRYIRITDFDEDGLIRDETFRSLPPEKAAPYLLDEGDVLFARSGATVGKTFIFAGDYQACFAGYLIRASTDRSRLLPEYLYLQSKAPMFADWRDRIFSQSTIQNIGADKYGTFPIILPPVDEQKTILQLMETHSKGVSEVVSFSVNSLFSEAVMSSHYLARVMST